MICLVLSFPASINISFPNRVFQGNRLLTELKPDGCDLGADGSPQFRLLSTGRAGLRRYLGSKDQLQQVDLSHDKQRQLVFVDQYAAALFRRVPGPEVKRLLVTTAQAPHL